MEKVLMPFNPQLKDEIEHIRFSIQAEQNGIASRRMGNEGYKKNYGVTYPVLKNIAEPYVGNATLASCLWSTGYRETMIIATLIYPTDKFTEKEATTWLADMQCDEIVQYACMNLYSKMNDAENLVTLFYGDTSAKSKDMAYLLAAQLIENGNKKFDASTLLNNALNDILKNKSSLPISAAQYLKQLGLHSAFKQQVMNIVDQAAKSDAMTCRWVAEEVRTFVEYTEPID